MNFLDQPQELIINEELVQVPIDRLMLACRANPQLNKICQGRELWITRIKREFPEVDTSQIQDPRAFYLRQSTFGGEIYVHYPDRVEQLQQELIPYEDLFIRVKEIAESLKPEDKDYYIVYSRPGNYADEYGSHEFIYMTINGIAYQTKSSVNIRPGPAMKITLVDIFYVDMNSEVIDAINTDMLLRDIDLGAIPRGQTVMVGDKQLGRRDLQNMFRRVDMILRSLDRSVLGSHEASNTAFYQRESKLLNEQRHTVNLSRYQRLIKNPIIPDQNPSRGPIIARKQNLLHYILTNVPQNEFDEINTHPFGRGFADYNEFTAFQRDYINGMTEPQFQKVESLRRLIPVINVNDGYKPLGTINRLMFSPDGEIVLSVGY